MFDDLGTNKIEFYSIIEGSVVRAHQNAFGGKGGPKKNEMGRSSGGLSTKIYALVDSRVRPIYFEILPGQAHNISRSKNLSEGSRGKALVADKAYGLGGFIEAIRGEKMRAIIPSKTNSLRPRRHAKVIYRKRI